jgi:hypothetical protein
MFFHPIKILSSVGLVTLALTSQTHRVSREVASAGVEESPSLDEKHSVKRVIFQHEDTGATIDYVENSGICETTPGVNQYSGYLTVGGSLILVPCPKREIN